MAKNSFVAEVTFKHSHQILFAIIFISPSSPKIFLTPGASHWTTGSAVKSISVIIILIN